MGKIGDISILGGGPAGLSVGYYANKAGIPFKIFEAGEEVGGLGLTHRIGDFLFDMGAHRFHDKDPEVTSEVSQLLGQDLVHIEVPSKIYDNGKLVSFPLTPLDLMVSLGPAFFTKAGLSLLQYRLRKDSLSDQHFESYAEKTYGRVIAERFLLNYSEKLWGYPCNKLSPIISGKRLRGLDLRTFLTEAILGSSKNTQHMEGAFYYPRYGFGMITQALADNSGKDHIKLNSKVTKIHHADGQITAIEINHDRRFDVEFVVSTLPVTLFLQLMNPEPDRYIRQLAKGLVYRNLILVAFFLDKPSITQYGTVYFPSYEYPFTRISEPRNRSVEMSPPGKTSLLVEIPCGPEDDYWNYKDDQIIEQILIHIRRIGWIEKKDLLGSYIRRISFAYPILTLGYESVISKISEYLDAFSNLHIIGRNGLYAFSSFHHQLLDGKLTVRKILREYFDA